MNNKSYLYLTLVLTAFLITGGCGKTPDEQASSEKNSTNGAAEIIATVNGQPITQQRLNQFTSIMSQTMSSVGDHNSEEIEAVKASIKKEALKKLVQLELLYQASKAKNIKVTDEDVDQIFNKLKSRFKDPKDFEAELVKTKSTEKSIREDIQRNLYVEKLLDQEILPQIKVTEEQSSAFYEKEKDKFKQPEGARISHILVKVAENATPEEKAKAKQKIEEVKKQLDNGKDFAELAKTNSDCPSAINGGDLGFIVKGKTVPEFEKTAFSLEKPGQFSKIIETSFGFHILKLTEKRAAGTVPFKDARKNIVSYLKNKMLSEKLDNYVKELYAKAKIESDIDVAETPVKAN